MAITTAERLQITQLYVALFGRAPDADGLGFWVQKLDSGTSLTAIADAMYATTPARAYYPLFLTNTEIITAFYVNVLGRSPDTEGLNYWLGKLNAAGATPGSVINQMVSVVVNYTGTDPAGITSHNLFMNKVEVAEYWAEHVGTVAGSTAILSTITADHATVVAAETAINTPVPVNFNLTTGVDNIDASGSNTVTGTADTAGTFTTGDIIKGNGSTTFNLTVNGTPPSLATVANVGHVNINMDATSTVNADLWSGIGEIDLVSPTLNGTTLTLNNAQVATTYGVIGNNGSVTVTYRDTTGTADTAHVALAGAGTSTFPTTVDVSSGNSVEGLVIATSGTNVGTINGGTADKAITLGGTGTNTLTFGALAGTLTFDASTSTGTNKFTFASGSIGAEDTISGGTGADTVTANGATTFAHMTGVETFVTTVNGGVGLFDGANVSGLTTMTINQGTSAGAEFFTNMKGEFATLNINGPTLTQEVDYVTGANATLAVNYGAGTSSDTTFDGLSVTNVKNLTVSFNEGGVAPNVMTIVGDIVLDKNSTTSLTLLQNGSDDTFSTYHTVERADSLDNIVIRATGDNSSIGASFTFHNNVAVQGLQTIEITASGVSSTAYFYGWESNSWSTSGSGATFSVTSTTNAMNLTSFLVQATGADSSAYMDTYVDNIGHMTSFTVQATANNASAYMYYEFVNQGDLDNYTLLASGNNAYVSQDSYVTVTDGNVGQINLVASGHTASAYMDYTFFVTRGNVGTVNITASGASSYAYLYDLSVASGDVGTVNITASANDASATLSYIYVGTGNLDALNIKASGSSSTAYVYEMTVYGNVGAVNITASGASSSAYLDYGYVYSGDVTSISLTASGDSAEAYGYQFSVYTGDVGSWSLVASGDGASAYQEFEYVGGSVGTMVITASGQSSSAYLYTDLSVTGDVGSLTVTASGQSADASFDGYYMVVGGNLGTVSVTASGQEAYASAYAYVSGNVNSVAVTASGQDSSAYAYVYQNDGSMNLLQLSVNATNAGASAYAYVDTGTGILGTVTMQATKANSTAYLDFTGNSFGSITATTAAPSSTIDMYLDNTTSAGGTITASGSGQVYIDIQEKSITSLSASGETNKVTVVVDLPYTKATAGMTLTTGSFADNVMGGSGVDTFNLGGGADTFNFSNLTTDNGTVLSAVTDIIAGGFVSGSDKLDFVTAGASSNYTENLTAAASLSALITAADTALNGTIKYYFGVVGTDGYLVHDEDGTGITDIVKITGVVDMNYTDII